MVGKMLKVQYKKVKIESLIYWIRDYVYEDYLKSDSCNRNDYKLLMLAEIVADRKTGAIIKNRFDYNIENFIDTYLSNLG
jgi:hypothetical protein